MGPEGDGVLQTSGIVAVPTPLLPLWTSERPLMLIVTGIGRFSVTSARRRGGAPTPPPVLRTRSWSGAEHTPPRRSRAGRRRRRRPRTAAPTPRPRRPTTPPA